MIRSILLNWHCQLFHDKASNITKDYGFNIPRSVYIHCYNEGSIKMATYSNINSSTKHIATRHHYTREKIEIEETHLIYVPSLEQVIGIFTKPLEKQLFEKFRAKLNIISIKEAQS